MVMFWQRQHPDKLLCAYVIEPGYQKLSRAVLRTSHKLYPSAGRAIRGATLNKQFILSYDLYIVLGK